MSEPPSPERPPAPAAVVFVADEQSDHPVDAERWARLAEHALVACDQYEGELSLFFVDEETIADLNGRFMGAEGPTDVLAFPIDEILPVGGRVPDGGDDGPHRPPVDTDDLPLLLGDVMICPAVAARNAVEHGTTPHPGHPTHDGSLDDELALLVVHGVLHVLGHDHAEPEETAAMQQRERDILAGFATTEPGSDRP
ncbi:MAG: rRNA maturation RNase YbeY [Acidimicrobiales bacterium]